MLYKILFTICYLFFAVSKASSQSQNEIRQMALEIAKNNIMLSLETSKSEVYVGEALIADYYLIVNPNIAITSMQITELPKFQSMKYQELNIGELKYTDTIIDEIIFKKSLLHRFLLIPQKPTSTKAGSIEFDFGLRIPLDKKFQQNKNQYFNDSIDIEYSAISNTIALKINDLPHNLQKCNFVGDFEINHIINKITAHPNEHIVLNISITGVGYLGSPFVPDISKNNELKLNIYPVKDTFEFQNNEIISKKDYEINIISSMVGEYMVEPIEVLCFSPTYKEYYLLSTESIPIFYTDENVKLENRSNNFNILKIILVLIFIGVVTLIAFLLYFYKKKNKLNPCKSKIIDNKHDLVNKYLSNTRLAIDKNIDIFLKELSLGIDAFIKDVFKIEPDKFTADEMIQLLEKKGVYRKLSQDYLLINQKIEEMRFSSKQSNIDREKLLDFIKKYLYELESCL